MKQQQSWSFRGVFILLALLVSVAALVSIYLFQKANATGINLFQLYYGALLLGLVVEYRRLTEKWSTVLWTALGAYIFSFYGFLQWDSETTYIFEYHLEMWPYYFLGFFIFIAMALQYSNIMKKMTEGITLLLTIGINYWIIANDFWVEGTNLVKGLIALNVAFSLFSLYNALSYKTLSIGSRLTLSIWSSVITLILSIDNILKVYEYKDIERLPTFSDSAFMFFQFFFLGISSIYIAQNISMVWAYLPGKRYLETVRMMNDIHLERFSTEQVYRRDSIIVMLISITLFSLNFMYEIVPVNFMIWAMVAITPLLLYAIHKVAR